MHDIDGFTTWYHWACEHVVCQLCMKKWMQTNWKKLCEDAHISKTLCFHLMLTKAYLSCMANIHNYRSNFASSLQHRQWLVRYSQHYTTNVQIKHALKYQWACIRRCNIQRMWGISWILSNYDTLHDNSHHIQMIKARGLFFFSKTKSTSIS